jgi:thiamine-phosphate pyrophosphorylase
MFELKGSRSDIRGVYAVTPDESNTEKLLANAEAALRGGVRMLQYRNKSAAPKLAYEQAVELRALCVDHNCLFIVNDDWRLALEMGADGVHVGSHDDDPANILAAVKSKSTSVSNFIVGVSCYDDLKRGEVYSQMGVDYLAFGAAFPSITKPKALLTPLAHFQTAKTRFQLPIVAIGGITLGNAPKVIDAGADAIAIISSLFNTADITLTAQLFSSYFQNHV